jgi:sec-independent protein translocase protein TatA
MPNIGPAELAIVLVIALLILGPKRLPEAGRSLGKGLREFKRSIVGGAVEPESRATNAPRARLADDQPLD